MKQVLVKQGQVILENVPVPAVAPGSVLVRVEFSCISVGTEMSGVRASGLPLWKRALKQPQNVKKAFKLLTDHGFSSATSQISDRLSAATATGYSASGIVVATGEGVEDFQPGDRVACAGAQCAFHAEYICVPCNLVVAVDSRIEPAHASTVTLGAIALQGVRRATPTLGETFVVIGLGILGQLTVQLLKSNGCRVIGIDLDSGRIQLARQMGMDLGIAGDVSNDVEQVARLTDGWGADGVIITAATPSDQVISKAFGMCRKKGRVVLVGDIGLNLNRSDFYQKELDFFISCSYGPGRYDADYEEHGQDYPIGYVRWTENRNMQEYLRQLAEGRVSLEGFIPAIYPVDNVAEAYDSVKSGESKPLMVLLSYPKEEDSNVPLRTIANPNTAATTRGQIQLAVVGAGNYAKGMHLPILREMSDRFQLHTIVGRTGHSAIAAAKQFGAARASTDFAEVLRDPSVDAVLIATRHNTHAGMTLQALKAGKHVFVEKPLALERQELAEIEQFYANTIQPVPLLLTGFNRRFSPYARRIAAIVADRSNPMIIHYRMNAGYLPLDHWVHTAEGGGRNKGEACHIYDLFTFLTGSCVTRVTAAAISPNTGYYSPRDNFTTTISFADGSIATLTYTAMGSRDCAKEYMEVFADGMTLILQDFKSLEVMGSKAVGLKTKLSEKGQREELLAFADVLKTGTEWPIPLWQQIQTTDIANRVDDCLVGGA